MRQQLSMFDMLDVRKRYVRRIRYEDAVPFIMEIHYARRIPSITDAFGLFEHGELVGVVTYGVPASHTVCEGLAGEENRERVRELNRLVIRPEYNGDNRASYLVSHSLKMLPRGTFVVSYADTAWTHIGYVYQACNFTYTGSTFPRTDCFSPDGKHERHNSYVSDRNIRQTRSVKHRYVYCVGNRKERREMKAQVRYMEQEYPKGDEVRYDPKNPRIVNERKVWVKNEQTTVGSRTDMDGRTESGF